jgi:glycosyltransferase involved in cell wall biosynthesis
MNTEPLVSVIIPAWNAEAWISETLRSVLEQSWPKLQVVVVDDESTDDTVLLVERSGDERVQLVTQPHRGAAAARNAGLARAVGDLIQFLDADDLLDSSKLSLQIEALRNHPAGSIASGTWSHFSGDVRVETIDEKIRDDADPVMWLTESLSGNGMMHPAAWLIPRIVADAAGPWNETLTLHDDGDYFARVLVSATRHVFVKEARVFYRSVAGSLSRHRSRQSIESAFTVCKARQSVLLAVRDTSETRRAVATQYAQFAYEFFSQAPGLAQASLESIKSLGVSPANKVGGPSFRKSVALIGFEKALKLRGVVSR